jgi:hypothetical protein
MMLTRSASHSRPRKWALRALLAPLMAVPVVAIAAPSALADPTPCTTGNHKCYSFTISAPSSTPTPFQATTYTGTLVNHADSGAGVSIGSANIDFPAGVTVVAGSVQSGGLSNASETVVGSEIQLRNISIPPGGVSTTANNSGTFTFTVTTNTAGTFTVASTAHQANNYSSGQNDFYLYGPAPTVQSSAPAPNCSSGSSGTYNDFGCGELEEAQGGTTSTHHLTSSGAPSAVSADITYKPLSVPRGRYFDSILRTDLGGADCPTALSLSCDFEVTVVNKIPADYTTGADAVSMVVECQTLCTAGVPRVWWQLNQATGQQEPLLPCLPIGTVTSPLSGSTACVTDNNNGTYTIQHISTVNDWKIMSGII